MFSRSDVLTSAQSYGQPDVTAQEIGVDSQFDTLYSGPELIVSQVEHLHVYIVGY